MADSAQQPQKKTKRRLRPSSATVRERTETSAAADQKVAKSKRQVPKTVRTVGQPFGWVLRIIFPRFLRNAFRELRQVSWPNRRESRQLTTAVIVFSLVFGAFVSLLDYGISQLFKKVILHQ